MQKIFPITLLIIVSLTIGTGLVSAQSAEYWIVTGQIKKMSIYSECSRSSVKDIRVGVYEAKEDGDKLIGHQIMLENGYIINPETKTDASGRFSIRVKRSLFSGKRFVLVTDLNYNLKQCMLMNRNGSMVIELRDSTSKISLGEVIPKP